MSFSVKIKGRPAKEFYNDRPAIESCHDVVWFLATGHELEMVRSQFKNVPITNGEICIWTGEMAHFVFKNLVVER
jgi:hypothetical protein